MWSLYQLFTKIGFNAADYNAVYKFVMLILVLIIMLGLLAYDTIDVVASPTIRGPIVWAVVLGANAVLAGVIDCACWRAGSALDKGLGVRATLHRMDQVISGARWVAVVFFLASLFALGWLGEVRRVIGDWVLLDEIIAALPVLVMLVAGWVSYYRIECRLRGATGSRWAYVVSQTRTQILFVLAPACAILAWFEAVSRLVDMGVVSQAYEQWVAASGVALVFLTTPLMMRFLWDTGPLPCGEVANGLWAMCRMHRVRVRGLLLWRTWGGLVNGAVMGVAGPLRYILLTDGLLARMTPIEVEAVMAHEIGHVRLRHMVWLVVCAAALVYGLAWPIEAVGEVWEPAWVHSVGGDIGVSVIVLPLWALAFGWVSRRFERQADVFAVRHLSRRYFDAEGSGRGLSKEAVEVYCNTLGRVAQLNSMRADRSSWRHGSILWRCRYLRSLPGRDAAGTGIDWTVRWVCGACVGLILLLVYDEAAAHLN